MSNEMIERVAKEIQKIYPLSSVGLSLTAAKIAIEAMREPTAEMRKVCRFEFAEVDYPAMINAALKDG